MKITVNDLYQKLQAGKVQYLVDVRSEAEFHSERFDIKPLVNHPLDQIDTLELSKDSEI